MQTFKINNMKKITISIVAAFISASSFAQTIPNAGFENWSTVSSYQNPDGWDNLNSMTAPMSAYTCLKGTPGNPGSSYIKLISKNVSMMGIMPGVAVSGVIDMTTYSAASGFAFTQRPQSLNGAWQYMASGADAGYVAAYLTQWNTGTNQRDTIAMINESLTSMAMSWTNFSLNFMYMSNNAPDSAIIILSSSGPTPVANSYLYVDNLAFAGSVAGITENKNAICQLSIFPNPANNQLNINVTGVKNKAQVDVYNVIGSKVKTLTNVDFSSNQTIDISSLADGQYILKITSSNTVLSRKFFKQ